MSVNIKPDNIPFIHNYCDRWCERCRFVDRCAVGSSEKLLETELKMELTEFEEERNKIVFQHVTDNFAETTRLLEKMITEAGLDFEEIQREARENPYKKPELTSSQKQIKELSHDYGMNTHGWMEKTPKLFEPDALMQRAMTQPKEPEVFMKNIKNAIETINWFCFFINVKTQRACSGKQADYHEEEDDLLQSDFNGSAKVALIATGRSIEAWEVLMKAFPEIEDMIIRKLALLQKISKLLLIEFPDAPKFTRPGFDEVKYDYIQ